MNTIKIAHNGRVHTLKPVLFLYLKNNPDFIAHEKNVCYDVGIQLVEADTGEAFATLTTHFKTPNMRLNEAIINVEEVDEEILNQILNIEGIVSKVRDIEFYKFKNPQGKKFPCWTFTKEFLQSCECAYGTDMRYEIYIRSHDITPSEYNEFNPEWVD